VYAQDGGIAVHDIGNELQPEQWQELARGFFLT
jgi:hypothetical protein